MPWRIPGRTGTSQTAHQEALRSTALTSAPPHLRGRPPCPWASAGLRKVLQRLTLRCLFADTIWTDYSDASRDRGCPARSGLVDLDARCARAGSGRLVSGRLTRSAPGGAPIHDPPGALDGCGAGRSRLARWMWAAPRFNGHVPGRREAPRAARLCKPEWRRFPPAPLSTVRWVFPIRLEANAYQRSIPRRDPATGSRPALMSQARTELACRLRRRHRA